MRVQVKREAGWYEAIEGISLSYNVPFEQAEKASFKLAPKNGGHNKFLESMVVWIDITAPRYWWQEFDTYRVGTTKQSESTIHTVMRRPLTQNDFEDPIPDEWLNMLNRYIEMQAFSAVKNMLPEGFLQRRIVCLNYQVLRNIIAQRKNHKLPQWRVFINSVIESIQWPYYVKDNNNGLQ